ncbi:MAG: hypothetical protein EBR23_02730 [Planctomycetia bacterium]|jgi:hypothetical protein|nr:hypothetical protein [Planctomycetia bacterium]
MLGMIACSVLFASGCSDPVAEPTATGPKPVAKAGPLRKTTQEVLDLESALQAGARRADAAEPRQGLDAVSGTAVSSAATIGMLAVEQKMKLFEAEHGRKPETHAEFMDRIIEKGRPGAVFLPALPSGKAYAFDPQEKIIVVVALPSENPPAP